MYYFWDTEKRHSFILLIMHNSLFWGNMMKYMVLLFLFFSEAYLFSHCQYENRTKEKKKETTTKKIRCLDERSKKIRIQVQSFGPLNIFSGSNLVLVVGILTKKCYELLKAVCNLSVIKGNQSNYKIVL